MSHISAVTGGISTAICRGLAGKREALDIGTDRRDECAKVKLRSPQENTMRDALQKYFGFSTFLDGQEEVLEQVLGGQDLCVVMPTGAGKSLCYQLPILMRSGYGLVVSPLISLMKDQVDALQAKSIPAAYVNSTVPAAEQRQILNATAAGTVKILYVAPERFRAPSFRQLLEECPPQLLVVDEAHCISQWGHDFRPDYVRLGAVIEALGVPQVCGFTATATPLVREDICRHLRRPEMSSYVAGFQRPNLSFSVQNCRSKAEKQQTLNTLLADPKPTIIYASTRAAVDEIAKEFDCTAYHAGMGDEARTSAQDHFMRDPCPTMVATNAFGMGIDRPDVRRVIHYNMPGSLEAYYQEAGRAGRDGEAADCILLFAYSDRFVQEFLNEINNPSESLLRQLCTAVQDRIQGEPSGELQLRLAELLPYVPEAKSEKHLSAALRILEKHGCVERGYRRDNQGMLRFTENLENLRILHQHESTQRSRFIYRHICRFGDVLSTGIRASYDQLAFYAGLRVEQIQRVVRALHGEVLEWQAPFSGRTIRIPADGTGELKVDFAALNRKREFDMARLDGVVNYAQDRSCRQRFLVNYFGQDVDDWSCEACDLCRRLDHDLHRAPTESELEVVKTILKAIQAFEGHFGRGRIAQVLAGSRNKEIISWRLDRHRCYGVLRGEDQSHLLRFIDALQKSGCVIQVGDPKYPCIDITPSGFKVMDGEAEVKLDFPESKGRKSRIRSRSRTATGGAGSSGTQSSSLSPRSKEDDELYEKLRELRTEMAEERGVPAYQILTNATLDIMVTKTPVTPDEALRIKGIGEVKARTIVPPFLKAIAEWRRESGLE